MALIETVMSELNYETALLEKCLIKANEHPVRYLKCSQAKNGYLRFYTAPSKKDRKCKYIKRTEVDDLRSIAYGKYLEQKIFLIKRNIKALENVLSNYTIIDEDSVIARIPKTYIKAIGFLRDLSMKELKQGGSGDETPDNVGSTGVIQSENPFHREELKHSVSNGLLVRSKGEVAISEVLLTYGVNFRYEMALKLKRIHVEPDGHTWTEEVTKYPDFTIFLPDGRTIYWEHVGKFDDPEYRERHFRKIELYYDNGIYEPYNLIITMESNDKPYDGVAIKRIIDTMILPFM